MNSTSYIRCLYQAERYLFIIFNLFFLPQTSTVPLHDHTFICTIDGVIHTFNLASAMLLACKKQHITKLTRISDLLPRERERERLTASGTYLVRFRELRSLVKVPLCCSLIFRYRHTCTCIWIHHMLTCNSSFAD